MQSWPAAQSLACTHAALASACVRHTPSFAQYPMRVSIVRQYASPCDVEHVYLQNPSTHFCAAPPVLHCVSDVQFGVGRVSRTHAPWLQYLPLPQSASALQLATHAPETHFGAAGSVHCASPTQPPATPPSPPPLPVPVAFGSHTPLVQVKPSPHDAVSQLGQHCPSAQIFPDAHSLVYLQVFVVAVHAPATQLCPELQSVALWQGHGPAVPPQAWHAPPTQTLPAPQSALVVHSFVPGGGVAPGAAHVPDLQTVPFGQLASLAHVWAQFPVLVQTWPLGQLDVPVHDCVCGSSTFEHP